MHPSRPIAIVAAGLVGLLLLGCGAPAHPPVDDPAPPGASADRVDGWTTVSPAAAGFRTKRLSALAGEAKDRQSTCLAVVRGGDLVADWNWGVPRIAPREVFSVTKSVTGALVGIAVRDGSLDVGDRVSRYVRAWRGTDSRKVTVRNLLSNDSGRFWSLQSDYVALGQATNRTKYAVGLAQQYPPGSAWAYNNAAIQVLDRVLTKATGMPTTDFAAERLVGPLAMTHTSMTRDAGDSSTNTYFGLQTTCLDLARFGRLFLKQGKVGTHRLVSRRYVASSVGRSSTEHNAAYGFLWWLNRYGQQRGATDAVDEDGQPLEVREGRLVPGAPRSLYSAIGYGGQIAMVDRRSRTIVVRLGSAADEDPYGLADATRVVTWALR